MKHSLILLPMVLLAPLAVLHAEGDSEPLKLYVSKTGSDQWSGKLADPNASNTDGPLAALRVAQAKVRSQQPLSPRLRRGERLSKELHSRTIRVDGGVRIRRQLMTLKEALNDEIQPR